MDRKQFGGLMKVDRSWWMKGDKCHLLVKWSLVAQGENTISMRLQSQVCPMCVHIYVTWVIRNLRWNKNNVVDHWNSTIGGLLLGGPPASAPGESGRQSDQIDRHWSHNNVQIDTLTCVTSIFTSVCNATSTGPGNVHIAECLKIRIMWNNAQKKPPCSVNVA